MIAHNDLLCRQAKSYYYDFLYSESCELIPEHIISHIENCQQCQKQVNQLKKEILMKANAFESQRKQDNSAAIEMLKLHFAYIGKEVTCDIVKPFLPGLLESTLAIRIPTPITAHLDNCQRCSENLETIRKLNLSRKQLLRLSQLLAENPAADDVGCSQAQTVIPAVVSMAFSETNAGVLKHLCTCPCCRELLCQCRQAVYKKSLHSVKDQIKFPCKEVSAADIFDYVVPYGLDPSKDEYAKFRKSFTSHVATCPNCLAKMQQLHRAVFGIAERAESGIATIYHIDESAKTETVSESDDIYTGFPVRVEVIRREDEVRDKQPVPTINFTGALKQRISAMNLKSLLKPTIAAAAVILIAVALFVSTTTAKAVTIDKIYKALERVRNVYISRFVPNKKEPIQEKWVSRESGIYMTKTGEKLVLWDILNGVKKLKHADTNLIETVILTDNVIAGIEKKMSGSLGLIPFYDISEIPSDAHWNKMSDKNLNVTEDVEVYNLEWIEKAFNVSSVFKKWRLFINTETNLPQRTEFYQKLTDNSKYILISVNVIEYLSKSQMQAMVEKVSF